MVIYGHKMIISKAYDTQDLWGIFRVSEWGIEGFLRLHGSCTLRLAEKKKKVWRRAAAEPHPEMTPSRWWPLHLHYAVQHLRLKKTPYPAAARSWDLDSKCPVFQACYAIMPCCCFGSVAKRKVGCWMLPAGLDVFITQAQGSNPRNTW